ncbi:MAG: TM2 domain-containing protein [Saccharofermentanales bacterium]
MPDIQRTFCHFCGSEIFPGVHHSCSKNPQFTYSVPQKSKITAGLLALFLGGLGIHKFYLNRAGLGILYLLFCWTYIPTIISAIEGIIYFTTSDKEFYNKYVVKD